MKYLFLILGLIICFARGLYADDGEAQRITESVMSTMGGDLRVEYDVLIEKVRAINPNIIENLEALDLSEDGKISVLRSYLAHESFNYYKNKFLSDLKERAQETAREIKSDDWQTVDKNFEITENTYWLDRGELDTKKCRSDEGFMVCQYPDGFEEFSVRIRETVSVNMADTTYSTQELVLTKDVPSEDYSLRCSITLNIKKNEAYSGAADVEHTENMYTAYLHVFCSTKKYSEYHAWRNQEVSDVVAGKYDVVGVAEMPEGSPFGKYVYETRMNQNPDEWKSNKLPAEAVTGFTSHFSSSSSSSNQTKNKVK